MNVNRYLFYFIICLIVSIVDVLRDLANESFIEAIEFVPVTLIVAFVITVCIYYIRLWIFKKSWVKEFLNKNRFLKWGIYTLVVISKTIVFTFIIRLLAQLFNPNYTSYSITGLFFWASFTAILSMVLFVYVIEAFLESETEKKAFGIRLAKIENEKIIARYLSLKNQLNPHFLFNSFNSLSALIHLDADKADNFLQELSKVYRYNLDHSDELVVTLENELTLIKSYLELQRIRFNNGLVVSYNIHDEKRSYLLPPMTLELLVENAIKHNVIEKSNPLKIMIFTHKDYIIVENNLQLRNTAVNTINSLGIGLKNLKNQYELVHKEVPMFSVENKKYIAKIPLIKPNM